ncbi:MAG: hypothetical protein AAB639_01230 [Patescibacteria group bacterium]
MPEHDVNKERLRGETLRTGHSDAEIEARITELRSEIQGLPNPEIVIEGQSLTPVTTLPTSGETEVKVNQPPKNSFLSQRKGPFDSVVALEIVTQRFCRKRRKAPL